MKYAAEQVAQCALLYHAVMVMIAKGNNGQPADHDAKEREKVKDGLLALYRSNVPMEVQRILDIQDAKK
jgi:hypothetical protein